MARQCWSCVYEKLESLLFVFVFAQKFMTPDERDEGVSEFLCLRRVDLSSSDS